MTFTSDGSTKSNRLARQFLRQNVPLEISPIPTSYKKCWSPYPKRFADKLTPIVEKFLKDKGYECEIILEMDNSLTVNYLYKDYTKNFFRIIIALL